MNTKHVPTLETCQTLKELGFPQDTEFYWVKNINGGYMLLDRGSVVKVLEGYFSAPLVSELGEMLPKIVTIDDEEFEFRQDKDFITYHNPNNKDDDRWIEIDGITEAEARGKMLLYLKKEGLI